MLSEPHLYQAKGRPILLLAEGRVVELGKPADLVAAGGAFAKTVSLQKQGNDWSL